MIVSLYNYIVTKMRLKEINKTIEMFDSDNYPVQLLAQKDMLIYEQEHWWNQFQIRLTCWTIAVILAVSTYVLVMEWKV